MKDMMKENLVCGICSQDVNNKNMFVLADKLKKMLLAVHHDRVTDCVGFYQKKKMKQENVEMKFSHIRSLPTLQWRA
eukprot:9841047-Ditylum_brightwellii.AAC.1